MNPAVFSASVDPLRPQLAAAYLTVFAVEYVRSALRRRCLWLPTLTITAHTTTFVTAHLVTLGVRPVCVFCTVCSVYVCFLCVMCVLCEGVLCVCCW